VTDTQTLLKNPRSKIDRANRHINELRQRSAPLDRTLYELANPGQKERASIIHLYPTRYRVTFRPKQNISETFAGIIGDAFNNIREAFDYTAAAVVDTWGKRPEGPLYFPITKRKDLVSHTGLSAIENAVPGFAELFLKEIRPENGPNEHLWDFYTLHRDGKHNDFVPVVTVADISPFNARTGNLNITNCAMGFDAARPSILVDSGTPITMQNNFKTSVDVKFGKGTVFENEPVIPTLTQISQLASETIDWLASLIKRVKNIN
jgi:hypothetical protein